MGSKTGRPPSGGNLDWLPGLIEGGANLIERAGRNNSGNQRNNSNNDEEYYPVQPAYYAPPAPPPAPPKNTVAKDVKPKRNEPQLLLRNYSAEFDARQQNEASKAGGKVDAAIEEYLEKGAPGSTLTAAEKAQASKDWVAAVASGDPKKFEQFQKDYGSKLGTDQQKWLDTRVAILQYEKDLQSGLLSQAGKDERWSKINNSMSTWGPSILKQGVQDNVNAMGKYNDLGKLADLSQGADNPFGIMLVGFQNAGFSPDEMGDVLDLPIMTDPPAGDSTVAVADILIMNPEDNGQAVSYSIASHSYKMKPGEKQSLTQSYVLSFDPGNGAAAKQYTLSTGVYHFVLARGAWELEKVTPKVVIDNSQYRGTFNYLINGKNAALLPGQVIEHTDSSAIVIEFDRGDGGSPARKVLTTGTFVVGIDAAKQGLDLFESKDDPQSTLIAGGPSSGSRDARSAAKRTKQQEIEEALARLKARGK